MEKYLINYTPKNKSVEYQTTLELLNDEPLLAPPKPFVLGVLGNSSNSIWNRETIMEKVVFPLIGEQDRIPTSLILPSEGATSLLLQSWAERQEISANIFEADWAKLGKRARALRDARIMKESTHLLLFLGDRSDYYEKIAIREVKKGKNVYCVDSSHELIEYVS
jgi:hypothetical protein